MKCTNHCSATENLGVQNIIILTTQDFPGGSDGKASAYNAGDWVQFLGWEDLLENKMATHSSILAWKNPKDRETLQATVHGVAKSWT